MKPAGNAQSANSDLFEASGSDAGNLPFMYSFGLRNQRIVISRESLFVY